MIENTHSENDEIDYAGDALRQFLQNVHGYSEPPNQWQLSRLAAMLGTNVPEDHSHLSMNEAERRVALAAHIWDAAACKRQEIQGRLDRTRKNFEERNLFFGPLKIGTHYLPRINKWDEEGGIVPFKRYLEQVVGMAKEEDRVRWWRAYLAAKIRKDQHADRWATASPMRIEHPPNGVNLEIFQSTTTWLR